MRGFFLAAGIQHATGWRLIGYLLGQPVVTVNAVATALQISFAAASSAVNLLLEMDLEFAAYISHRRSIRLGVTASIRGSPWRTGTE
jgi:hypothetical protein